MESASAKFPITTPEPQSLAGANAATRWTWDLTRGNNFDFIRLAMALLVIFSHCYPLVYGTNHGYEPLARLLEDRSNFGTLAVDVFFVISGFLITMSWERSVSWFAYLLKRVARIVPAYVCLTLIGVFIVGSLFTSDASVWHGGFSPSQLWRTMSKLGEVIVPGVFARNPFPGTICGTVWTLMIEFCCYIGILILGVTSALRRRWIPLGLFLFYLGWIAIPHPPSHHRPLNPTCAPLICFFLAGSVFYLYRNVIPQRPWIAIVALLGVLSALLVPPLLAFTWPLCGTYRAFWIAFQPYVTAHHFSKHGDFSYGVYLYGFPIQQVLVAKFPGLRSPAILFMVAGPLAILAGFLSWHLVEKHFLRKRSLRLKAQ